MPDVRVTRSESTLIGFVHLDSRLPSRILTRVGWQGCDVA